MLANVKLSLLTPAGELARKRTHPVTQKDIARLVFDRKFSSSLNNAYRRKAPTRFGLQSPLPTRTSNASRLSFNTEIHAYLFTLSSRLHLQPKKLFIV